MKSKNKFTNGAGWSLHKDNLECGDTQLSEVPVTAMIIFFRPPELDKGG
jgi:hypothetical protein